MEELFESGDICHICQSLGEEGERLISPCACEGARKYVHPSCLLKLFISDGNGTSPVFKSMHCGYCSARYSFESVGSARKLDIPTGLKLEPISIFCLVRAFFAWLQYDEPNLWRVALNGILYLSREITTCITLAAAASFFIQYQKTKFHKHITESRVLYAISVYAIICAFSQTAFPVLAALSVDFMWSVDIIRDVVMLFAAIAIVLTSMANNIMFTKILMSDMMKSWRVLLREDLVAIPPDAPAAQII